ncbi:hypothetical protein AAMO2058_001224900 [Amorphochlora amoebiformis]
MIIICVLVVLASRADASCDTSTWGSDPRLSSGDIKEPCSNCMALVDNFDVSFQNCNDFCSRLGLYCIGAWEETGNACRKEYNSTCNAELGSTGTSDVLCRCSETAEDYEESAPDLGMCTPRFWNHVLGVCDTCKVLVQGLRTYKTCDRYCQSQGLSCTGAWNDEKSTCVEKATYNCTTDHNSDEGICECQATLAPTVTFSPTVSPQVTSKATVGCQPSVWNATDNDTCGSCSAVASNMFNYRTCENFCASQQGGLFCISASKTGNGITCQPDVSENVTCTSDHWALFESKFAVCECSVTLAPTPSNIVIKEKSNNHNAVIIGATIGCVAGVAIIAAVIVYWRMKKNSEKNRRWGPPGLLDDNHGIMTIDMKEASKELPEEIDIFSKLNSQDPTEWNNTFSDLSLRVRTQKNTQDSLLEHGKSWKAHLLSFLSTKFAQAEDAQIRDAGGKQSSLKVKFVATAVTVMSSIDAQHFMPKISSNDYKSNKPELWRLRQSMALIRDACKFGSREQERNIRYLHIFALVNQVRSILYSGVLRREPSFAAVQWKYVQLLCIEVLRILLVDHTNHPFIFDQSEAGFTSERLIRVTSQLLSNPNLKNMLKPEGIKQMKHNALLKERGIIDVRAANLARYGRLYSNLAYFMDEIADLVGVAKRRAQLALKNGQPQDPPVSQQLKESVESKDENKTTLAMMDIVEDLWTLKCGPSKSAIREAVLFSVQKLENSSKMDIIEKFATKTATKNKRRTNQDSSGDTKQSSAPGVVKLDIRKTSHLPTSPPSKNAIPERSFHSQEGYNSGTTEIVSSRTGQQDYNSKGAPVSPKETSMTPLRKRKSTIGFNERKSDNPEGSPLVL